MRDLFYPFSLMTKGADLMTSSPYAIMRETEVLEAVLLDAERLGATFATLYPQYLP